MARMSFCVPPRCFVALALALAAVAFLALGAPAAGAGDWECPVKGDVSYLRGIGGGHDGVDMAAGPFPYDAGRKVIAARTGTVTWHNDPGGYGRYIEFRSDGGRRFIYAHLKRDRLKPNHSHVERGQAIARVGKSGNATAFHLHFEAHDKVTGAPTDPMPKLDHCAWLNR